MKWLLIIFLLLLFLLFTFGNKQAQTTSIVTIGFSGDVMLGRLVNEKINQASFAYPWGNVLSLLQQHDLNIINLECTITKSQKPVPKVFNFKTDPKNIQTLIEGTIHVVNIANNHSLDFGNEGLFETLEILKNASIAYVGAGNNIHEAQQAAIITKKGITFGIIGFTDNEPEWLATETKPGTNYIHIGQIDKVQQIIKNVRDKVDILIASIHWGPNWPNRPSKEQINFAHALIDAGIDIIHGHSAHVFQGIEWYKKKLILYSTGDFVDDYMVDPEERNDISFLFQVTVDKTGIKGLTLIPTKIENMQVNKATGDDYDWALQKMKDLSQELEKGDIF